MRHLCASMARVKVRNVFAKQADRDAIKIEDEEQVSKYAELQQQEAESRSLIRSMVMQPRYALPFLQPGRLARVLTSAESSPATPEDADSAQEVACKCCSCRPTSSTSAHDTSYS